MKKIASFSLLVLFLTGIYLPPTVQAVSSPSVVINEIAWMGTSAEANDEWIELYNTTDQEIDLTGWYIEDDDSSKYTIASGKIPAHGYFVIEDSEVAINSLKADAVIGLSLSNSGDKLVLKDLSGTVIDVVNSQSSAWFSGNNTDKTSLERIDPLTSGDQAANWGNNKATTGSTDRSGGLIKGTPGSQNSVSIPAEDIAQFKLTTLTDVPNQGATVTITGSVDKVKSLFAYGATVTYDPKVLTYQSASAGAFLSEDNKVQTSFQAGLEDNLAGRLIIGQARTGTTEGRTGNGVIFTINFKVIGDFQSKSAITLAGDSFLSDPAKDLVTEFSGTSITVSSTVESTVDPVQNLKVAAGSQRYNLELTWSAPVSGADSYRILRKNQSGNFIEIGTVKTLSYLDANQLVPNVTYNYQIIAVKGDSQSLAKEISGQDSRGLTGDSDRTDRVDGRDLEKLAKSFGKNLTASDFQTLVDTNYDGTIDGKDLLDLAANWALNFSS